MSTERKPGSRGSMEPFHKSRTQDDARIGREPGARDNQESRKGSTKTSSPRKAFKKRPRK